ncbi:MAG: LegC family aminotransferase [Saprospiraceae bacterium]
MIPLSIPHLSGNEWNYVKECLDTGWVSSAGAFVERFESEVAKYVESPYAIAAINGTGALHIALQLMDVQQGDYVIVPDLTFVASCNAIRYTGADPLLMDIDPETWQLDLDLLENFLQEQTIRNQDGTCRFRRDDRIIRAIMPVHVLGNMVDMHRLMALARKHGLAVVEDATEALGSTCQGQHAGTFGDMGCFSFNGNKIITTGGGGMIVTNDQKLAKRAKHLTTQAKVSTEEYIHDEIGYNYRLVNILAAIGVAQMEQLPSFVLHKQEMDAYYRRHLAGVGDIEFQQISSGISSNGWLFTVRTRRMRELLHFLNEQGVQSRPFWMPMHQLPMFASSPYIQTGNQADQVYQTALSIPSSTQLQETDWARVVETIRSFFN